LKKSRICFVVLHVGLGLSFIFYWKLYIQVSQVVLVSDFFSDFLSDFEGCKPDPPKKPPKSDALANEE